MRPPRVGIIAEKIAGTGGGRRADSAPFDDFARAGVRLAPAYAIMRAATN
jgi:hypothetical protein